MSILTNLPSIVAGVFLGLCVGALLAIFFLVRAMRGIHEAFLERGRMARELRDDERPVVHCTRDLDERRNVRVIDLQRARRQRTAHGS